MGICSGSEAIQGIFRVRKIIIYNLKCPVNLIKYKHKELRNYSISN